MARLLPIITLNCVIVLALTAFGCNTLARFSDKDAQPERTAQYQPPKQPPLPTDDGVPRRPEDLKDPFSLQLAYARWQEHLGNADEARGAYQTALKKNPKSVEALVGLARLDELSQLPKLAERGYQEALKTHPKSALAMHALGKFYVNQERWKEGTHYLEMAARAESNNTRYQYDLGLALAQQGQYSAALEPMSVAIGEAEAHYNIGYLLKEAGRTQEARSYFQQAVALNPEMSQAEHWLKGLKAPGDTPANATPIQVVKLPAEVIHEAPQVPDANSKANQLTRALTPTQPATGNVRLSNIEELSPNYR